MYSALALLINFLSLISVGDVKAAFLGWVTFAKVQVKSSAKIVKCLSSICAEMEMSTADQITGQFQEVKAAFKNFVDKKKGGRINFSLDFISILSHFSIYVNFV